MIAHTDTDRWLKKNTKVEKGWLVQREGKILSNADLWKELYVLVTSCRYMPQFVHVPACIPLSGNALEQRHELRKKLYEPIPASQEKVVSK